MERKVCEECGGKIEKRLVEYNLLGFSLGKFEAEVCNQCKEEVFSEETFNKIEKKTKELGLWGLHARVKVNQLGNSVAVTITKPISEFLKLKKGRDVIIYPEDKHRLIIEIPED
ncbi:hypothetical protein HYX18_01015 [Candidatus Woesearchaeota archaeon]|nr:hypothetical protein [Candidatus Woesearchaeota archaeon]